MNEPNARFEDLYRRYSPRVFRFFARFVEAAVAQDLTQETFVRVYGRHPILESSAEWSYLEKVARNVLFNFVRERKAAKRSALEVKLDDPTDSESLRVFSIPSGDEPDVSLFVKETAERRQKALDAAISELPVGERSTLLLWLQDFSYQEIASTLGLSVDAVKSRLKDARQTLRKKLGNAEKGQDRPPNSR